MSELIVIDSKYLQERENALAAVNDRFIAAIKRDFTPSTYRAYREGMKRFIGWMRTIPNTDSVKDILAEYKANLRESFDKPNTINAHLTTVRGFAGFLYEQGITDADLSLHLKNVRKADGHTRTALDKYQLSDLIEILNARVKKRNGRRDRMIVLLTVSNGLRINEVANINIEDISQREDDKVIYLLRKGYSDKSCYTILNPKIYRELQTYIGDRKEGALFQSESGENLSSDSIGRIIRNAYRRAGIDSIGITPHSLRSTFATLVIKGGGDIFALSKAMNHKNVSTTQIYLNSLNRHETAVEKMDLIDF